MAFGYRVKNKGVFAEAARLYNPKLFDALKAKAVHLQLDPTPKSKIDQFATNFEQMLGATEGHQVPMRTDNTVFGSEQSDSSAA